MADMEAAQGALGRRYLAEQGLRSLRANVEFLDGDFGNVYLDNARPYGMKRAHLPFLSLEF